MKPMKSMPMSEKAMSAKMASMPKKGKGMAGSMPECMMGRMVDRHSPAQLSSRKVDTVMHEFKAGMLHSGSKTGPQVKSRKQAVAIAMSEAGMSRKGH